MRALVVAMGVGMSTIFFADVACAQYQYTDGKGVTRVTQYRVDVPARYRDTAVWIGATGVGKPGLSDEQRKTKQRDDAYRKRAVEPWPGR